MPPWNYETVFGFLIIIAALVEIDQQIQSSGNTIREKETDLALSIRAFLPPYLRACVPIFVARYDTAYIYAAQQAIDLFEFSSPQKLWLLDWMKHVINFIQPTETLIKNSNVSEEKPPLKRKIVLTDDRPELINLLIRIIEDEFDNCCILSAYNGAEALKIILENDPCLLILDLKMPIKNGHEVLKELEHQKSKMPIIVYSGASSEVTKAEIFASTSSLHIVKILKKPFELNEILNVLENVLTIEDQI